MSSSRSGSEPPKNWPANVDYLPFACSATSGLDSVQRAVFCCPLAAGSPLHPGTLRSKNYTIIKPVQDTQHPAYGQSGLFALTVIPPRTVIVPYLGVVHTEEESRDDSDYDLRVLGPPPELGAVDIPLGIDATHKGNEARFVNDFRGVAQRPNVFFEEYEVLSEDGSQQQRGLLIKSGSKPIRPGEELLVSYGKGFWAARRPDDEEEEESTDQMGDAVKVEAPQPAASMNHIQARLAQQRARLQNAKAKR